MQPLVMLKLTSSHVSGATDPPLMGTTIPAAFARTVARWGAREALVARHQGVRCTYAELANEVDALAAGLLALGLQQGDRIGIWAPNCAEWTVTQLATARIGLILVNINPALPSARARILAQHGRVQGACHRPHVQVVGLRRPWCARSAPRSTTARRARSRPKNCRT